MVLRHRKPTIDVTSKWIIHLNSSNLSRLHFPTHRQLSCPMTEYLRLFLWGEHSLISDREIYKWSLWHISAL